MLLSELTFELSFKGLGSIVSRKNRRPVLWNQMCNLGSPVCAVFFSQETLKRGGEEEEKKGNGHGLCSF